MPTRLEFSNNTEVLVDLTSNVTTRKRTRVGRYPVAKGVPISSTAYNDNTVYTINGVMSDYTSPNQLIGNQFLGTAAVTQFITEDRARTTLDTITKAQDDISFVTVELGFGFTVDENPNQRIIENLVIEDFSHTVSPDNQGGYSFTLVLTRPRIVTIANSVDQYVVADAEVAPRKDPPKKDASQTGNKIDPNITSPEYFTGGGGGV